MFADVLSTSANVGDERLRSVLADAVRHIHPFATETELRRDEWIVGIKFPTSVDQACREDWQ